MANRLNVQNIYASDSQSTPSVTIDENGISAGTLGSGVVFPTQYSFKAYKTSTQLVTSGNTDKVTFDANEFSTNLFDTTNNKFVCPKAGIWWIGFAFRFSDNTGAGTIVTIRKNGSIVFGELNDPVSSYIPNQTGSFLIELSVDDYIEMFAFINGASANVQAISDGWYQTQIEGFLLYAK